MCGLSKLTSFFFHEYTVRISFLRVVVGYRKLEQFAYHTHTHIPIIIINIVHYCAVFIRADEIILIHYY